MPFAIEFSAESERDFELIFDHLFESYLGFGESVGEALDHAMRRILDIRRAADKLSSFPIRGTERDDILPSGRYLSIDRTIFWFDADEAAVKVRILAVFFGGQDHVRHMLVRLLGHTSNRD
jgi:plasmid stabilization system protein ParE